MHGGIILPLLICRLAVTTVTMTSLSKLERLGGFPRMLLPNRAGMVLRGTNNPGTFLIGSPVLTKPNYLPA